MYPPEVTEMFPILQDLTRVKFDAHFLELVQMIHDGNVPKALCFERRLGRTTPPPGLNIGGNG